MPLEAQIRDIWLEVLRARDVGIDGNFFDLGGDSLQMAQVLVRIRRRLDCELTLEDFFEAPTVRQLAASVEACRTLRKEA